MEAKIIITGLFVLASFGLILGRLSEQMKKRWLASEAQKVSKEMKGASVACVQCHDRYNRPPEKAMGVAFQARTTDYQIKDKGDHIAYETTYQVGRKVKDFVCPKCVAVITKDTRKSCIPFFAGALLLFLFSSFKGVGIFMFIFGLPSIALGITIIAPDIWHSEMDIRDEIVKRRRDLQLTRKQINQ